MSSEILIKYGPNFKFPPPQHFITEEELQEAYAQGHAEGYVAGMMERQELLRDGGGGGGGGTWGGEDHGYGQDDLRRDYSITREELSHARHS